MIQTLPNFLWDVPVTLKIKVGTGNPSVGNLVSMPLFAEKIQLQHNWSRRYYYSSLKDFVMSRWLGGFVTFSGVFLKTENANMLAAPYADTIQLGTMYTLRICRRQSLDVNVKDLASGVGYVSGSFTYSFDAYT